MLSPTERSLISAFGLVALALLATGCPKPASPPKSGPAKVGLPAANDGKPNILLGDCEPKIAEVIVDGKSRGTIASQKQGGISVPPGVHRIEIRAEGYQAFRVELNVGDKVETLKIKLQPAL